MSGSVNKCIFVGNLGRDPESRTFQNGGQACSFSIACSETWKDKNTGERKEKTEWVNVTIFGEGLVRVAQQYLRKGSKVYIEGKLQTRKWQDQNGQDRYSTEVVLQGPGSQLVMLDAPNGGQAQANNGAQQGGYNQGQQNNGYGAGGHPGNNGSGFGIDEDSIPFHLEWRA